LVSMIAAGRAASIHLAPCKADAENPARTPRRRDRSQQACARSDAASPRSQPTGLRTQDRRQLGIFR
jgi:hypothetical protein